MKDTTLIKVSHISHFYNGIAILNDIDLSFNKGELIALLGINGAGKTTLMNILTGVLFPSEGKIFIDGIDINEAQSEIKKKIGYLSENNPLYEDMYVKEYLIYVANMYLKRNEAKSRLETLIDEVGLTSEYKKKIRSLSKGNKQRIGLAQALIHDPEILVLDEPSNGFDPQQQQDMKDLLLKMGETKTIILSTHHLHEVSDIATRFLILNKQKIVYDDYPTDVSTIDNIFYNFTI